MDLQKAKSLRQGKVLYSTSLIGSDKRPIRAKVTSVKTWKRSPERVLVTAKHGLYTYLHIRETTLDEWETDERNAMRVIQRIQGSKVQMENTYANSISA